MCAYVNKLADRITAELQVLVGEVLSDCWRAADMLVFGFGPTREIVNRRGEKVQAAIIMGNQFRGRERIKNDSKGDVQIGMNAVRR